MPCLTSQKISTNRFILTRLRQEIYLLRSSSTSLYSKAYSWIRELAVSHHSGTTFPPISLEMRTLKTPKRKYKFVISKIHTYFENSMKFLIKNKIHREENFLTHYITFTLLLNIPYRYGKAFIIPIRFTFLNEFSSTVEFSHFLDF